MAKSKFQRHLNSVTALILTIFIFGWTMIPLAYIPGNIAIKGLIALCALTAIALMIDRFLQKNPFAHLSRSYQQQQYKQQGRRQKRHT